MRVAKACHSGRETGEGNQGCRPHGRGGTHAALAGARPEEGSNTSASMGKWSPFWVTPLEPAALALTAIRARLLTSSIGRLGDWSFG